MPNRTGRFHLYLDISKFVTGSVLYQIQNGKPKAINIASFSHLLKRTDFHVIVDHLLLTHIIKSKPESSTVTIKRLLELISSYSFNLYYIKGKDMVLSDFLSRQKHDDSNPHKIIPISFNMYQVLHEKYYNIGNTRNYLV